MQYVHKYPTQRGSLSEIQFSKKAITAFWENYILIDLLFTVGGKVTALETAKYVMR